MTWCRGSRSATTPPSSRKATSISVEAVATNPTSVAEPPMARTANGVATIATELPAIEMTSHASSSRKFRLRSGPGGSLIRSRLIPAS